jgi:predicted GNAT family acetyltransferase
MVEVIDVPEEQRYVITVDGQRAGLLDYQVLGDVFVALHAEVDPAFAGQTLGATLVRQVLDEVREYGRRLRPRCPFVSYFLRENPEYADLVDEPRPEREEVS